MIRGICTFDWCTQSKRKKFFSRLIDTCYCLWLLNLMVLSNIHESVSFHFCLPIFFVPKKPNPYPGYLSMGSYLSMLDALKIYLVSQIELVFTGLKWLIYRHTYIYDEKFNYTTIDKESLDTVFNRKIMFSSLLSVYRTMQSFWFH